MCGLAGLRKIKKALGLFLCLKVGPVRVSFKAEAALCGKQRMERVSRAAIMYYGSIQWDCLARMLSPVFLKDDV